MVYYIVFMFILHHLLQELIWEQHVEMPTCSLGKTMHNKWQQQPCSKMLCLYEATMDDMICGVMQITNYHSWIKGGSLGKRPNHASLKLKVATHTGDPNHLVEIYEVLPRGRGSQYKDVCIWGVRMFGSTKRNLDLPPRFEYDSHCPNKVNCSILVLTQDPLGTHWGVSITLWECGLPHQERVGVLVS